MALAAGCSETREQPAPGDRETRTMEATQTTRGSNRLIHETSPYLLQHARNPVHWYAWGEEAFRRAKKEDKAVFLSVGYSTCHFCHVMERESFQREDVAEILNKHFIAIKVDREERPDVDEIYMKATHLMTGRGGWPNSVWLTPEGKPWHAGTYFPREDGPLRVGLKTILTRLAELWRTRRRDVEVQADKVAEAIRQMPAGGAGQNAAGLSRKLAQEAVSQLQSSFDRRWGGFGGAEKFPPHAALRLLLAEHRRTKDASALEMATRTLDAMSAGGIRDHVGGGFHRYATDARWLLPHFEKMLYDNAQLARAYAEAYAITGKEEYRRVVEGICQWVLGEMTDPAGGFYSALDADSEGEEGKFYLWSYEEIIQALGAEEGELFCRVYNAERGGNFRDEVHGSRPGTNILHLRRPIPASAKLEGMDEGQLRSRLARSREKLLNVRARRVRPHLDDKVLAGWNGLMIGSLAYAGRRLNRPEYIAAAEKAAAFVLTRMRKDGRLLRTWRRGRAGTGAYLDDYAFLADGLLDLHQATARPGSPQARKRRWRNEAVALVGVLDRQFQDSSDGGFFFTSDDHEDLLARTKSPVDRAIPAGNAVAARVLVRLGRLPRARRCIEPFAAFLRQAPEATANMILAVGMYLDAGGKADAERKQPANHSRAERVTAEAFAPTRRVAAGETVEVVVRLTMDPGWHVYSHRPQQENAVPTSVRLTAGAGTMGKVTWPGDKKLRPAGGGPAVSVYAGTVEIRIPITIAEDAPAGATTMAFVVQAQPCNDRRCLRPQTHRLSLPLEIRRR